MEWKQKSGTYTTNDGYKITTGERFAPGTGMKQKLKVYHCYDPEGRYIAQDYDIKEAKVKCTRHALKAEAEAKAAETA